jgi:adenylate cyclase
VSRLRIFTGLVLFIYALLHFLNIGLGLVSPGAMDGMQEARQWISRSWAGTILLYAALLTHAALALVRVASRGTLRMPLREAVQTGLGLSIPLLLITHITFTRLAHEYFGVTDSYRYLIGLIWGSNSGWTQAALLLIVWTHGCIGLHVWLRSLPLWRRMQPVLIALAVLVPGFALAGFIAEGRRLALVLADPVAGPALRAADAWPAGPAFDALFALKQNGLTVFWALLALACAAWLARRLLARRKSVRIRYVDGPEITAPRGLTLLEMSRVAGVPHTSLCGGKGRCTTCRVLVEAGADLLHPPSPTEEASLRAVAAPPGSRLACQIRPADPATVFRVFRPDGRMRRAHASQGQERRLAILFLDMRGFTARTAGQLPYDVVFLLNRFFDAIVPAITGAGGTVDKYLGDGLLAVFDAADEGRSARAALRATREIGAALDRFNAALAAEGAPPVRIGVGVHLGTVVLGEIGASGHAPRTIIGDTVNAASRLEAETKALGVEGLVSLPVLRAAGLREGGVDLRTLTLRGVADPLPALALARLSDLAEICPANGTSPERRS